MSIRVTDEYHKIFLSVSPSSPPPLSLSNILSDLNAWYNKISREKRKEIKNNIFNILLRVFTQCSSQ